VIIVAIIVNHGAAPGREFIQQCVNTQGVSWEIAVIETVGEKVFPPQDKQ